jgi:hypothetical protein
MARIPHRPPLRLGQRTLPDTGGIVAGFGYETSLLSWLVRILPGHQKTAVSALVEAFSSPNISVDFIRRRVHLHRNAVKVGS